MREHKGRNLFVYLIGPVLLYWGVSFLVQMAFGMYWTASTSDPARLYMKLQAYATEMTTAAAVIVIPVMFYLFVKDLKKEPGVEKIFPPEVYGVLVLAGAGLCISLNVLLMLTHLTGAGSGYQTVSREIYDSSFLVQTVGLGVLVPVAEELTYRGMLYRRLREYMGVPWAVAFSAAVFGILHGNLVQFVYAGLIGAVLAWVYERTGTIKAPVLLHIVVNMTSIIATGLHAFNWMLENVFRAAGITALAAVLAVFSLRVIKNKTY